MAGLVPAIHALLVSNKAWMPGTRPGMTWMGFRRSMTQLRLHSGRSIFTSR